MYDIAVHESPFAKQILESVRRQTAGYPGSRVTRIRLRAGKLLALDHASLTLSLEAIWSGTPVEGAAIELVETGPELNCPQCGVVAMEDVWDKNCPQCGQQGSLVPARDLVIEEIELSDAECTDT